MVQLIPVLIWLLLAGMGHSDALAVEPGRSADFSTRLNPDSPVDTVCVMAAVLNKAVEPTVESPISTEVPAVLPIQDVPKDADGFCRVNRGRDGPRG